MPPYFMTGRIFERPLAIDGETDKNQLTRDRRRQPGGVHVVFLMKPPCFGQSMFWGRDVGKMREKDECHGEEYENKLRGLLAGIH